MERPRIILFVPVVIAVSFMCASCSDPGAYYRILRGNYSYMRGDYQDANVQYLTMRKREVSPEIISYNLGNVYYVLGEPGAAEEEWLSASGTKHTELMFRLNFNRGVLYYEKSEYEMGFHFFRKALEIIPSDMEAKNNLEMCLARIHGQQTENSSVTAGETVLSDDVERVLQYIRRKEGGAWISTDQKTTDYRQDW